jgi:O-antigen ligase
MTARKQPLPAHSSANGAIAVLATLVGAGAALLPPLAVGVLALLALILIHPLVPFVLTLMVAPLKTLLDTERAFSVDLGQVAFALTVILYLAGRIAQRKRLFPAAAFGSVFWALCLMIAGASISLFAALDPLQTVSELVKWAEILVMAMLVAAFCAADRRALIVVLGGLFTAAALQALIGLYQFFGGSGAPSLWILDNRFFRAFGTYGQPNPFGAMMELSLALASGLLINAAALALQALWPGRSPSTLPARRNALLLGGLCALLWALFGAGLIASWSRGAWFGFGAGAVVILFMAPRRRWVGALLIGGGAAAVFGLAAVGLLPASLIARLSDFSQDLTGIADVRGAVITDDRYAVLERLAHWQAAVAMTDDHPLLGVGFGNYEAAYPRYALMNWPFPLGHAHNYYLNTLAETGIVGLLAYLAGWAIIIGANLHLLARSAGLARGIALGLLGTWAALGVHSLFDKLFVNNLGLHIGCMLGLILALRHPEAPERTI